MHLLINGHAVPVLAVFTLGGGVGFLAGLFGVGGGFLLTPLLHSLLGVPLDIAIGSGLCQMIGTATSALLRYQRQGHLDTRVGLFMLGGALLGVDAGARSIDLMQGLGVWRIAGRTVPAFQILLLIAYCLLLGLVAVYLVREGRRSRRAARAPEGPGPLARWSVPPFTSLPSAGLDRVSVPALTYLGLGVGFLSGLLGIGGGVVLMPALIYGIGLPFRIAAGTGLLILAVTAAFGTVAHALRGNVDLALASLLLVGSTVGAQLGAGASVRIPAARLKEGFAGVVLLTLGVLLAEVWQLIAH